MYTGRSEIIKRTVLGVMMFVTVLIYAWGIYETRHDARQAQTAGGAELSGGEAVTGISEASDVSDASEMQNAVTDSDADTFGKGNVESDDALDGEAIVNNILNTVSFDSSLEKLDAAVSEGMISIQKSSALDMYMGEGTHADQIIVLKSGDRESIKKDREAVENYLKDTKDSFKDYIPEEAEKTAETVIYEKGLYIIACVTSDTEHVDAVINDLF